MLTNPLIRRYKYSLMRPAQFWVYVTIYASIITLILLINYSLYIYKAAFDSLTQLFSSLYTQLLVLQTLMLLIWAAFNSGSAISQERTERTYDFFRILPLPAYKKMVGILIGKNLVVLLLAGINLLFLIFFGAKSDISSTMLLQTLFALFCASFLSNTIGLLSSLCTKGRAKAKGTRIGGILLLLVFGIPLLLHGMVALAYIGKLEGKSAPFYTLRLPVLILYSLVFLYFAAWAVIGILRKLNKEERPLFSRFGAMLFFAGYQAILTGLLSPHLEDYAAEITAAYWWLSIIPVLVIPVAGAYDMQDYLELAASWRRKNLSTARFRFNLLAMSNVAQGAALFALWTITTYLLKLYPQFRVPQLNSIVLTFAGFCLFLVLLLEIAAVYQPAQGKVALLAGFIAAAYVVLPPIFGGIFENETIFGYSPAGFLVSISSQEFSDSIAFVRICLYNLFLSIVPAILVGRRYAQIMAVKPAS